MSLEGWWMVHTTDRPVLASAPSVDTREKAMLVSSPDVGSSRYSSRGSAISSSATLVRLRSPPEMPLEPMAGLPTTVPLHLCSRRRDSASSTLASFSARPRARGRDSTAAVVMISCTVRVSSRQSSCCTKEDTCRRAEGEAGAPLTYTAPAVGATRPLRRLMRLVLPLPEGPMQATRRPFSATPSMPLRMTRRSCCREHGPVRRMTATSNPMPCHATFTSSS
mmetsp:Transcript_22729/g.63896  ORF Transcript_22729/g.63896 Transcript_22729/m.63896 type:complete len:222 (-) Transcript_22729:13-678(-)